MITLIHTTLGKTPLDGLSATRKPLPDNTQHLQETEMYGPGRIRTRNPSKLAVTEPYIRPRGQWDRHCDVLFVHPQSNTEENTEVISHDKV